MTRPQPTISYLRQLLHDFVRRSVASEGEPAALGKSATAGSDVFYDDGTTVHTDRVWVRKGADLGVLLVALVPEGVSVPDVANTPVKLVERYGTHYLVAIDRPQEEEAAAGGEAAPFDILGYGPIAEPGPDESYIDTNVFRPVPRWIGRLSSTKAALIVWDENSDLYACALDVSGTAITPGSLVQIHSSTSIDNAIVGLTPGKFIVAYTDESAQDGRAKVGTVDGTTVTLGSEATFGGTAVVLSVSMERLTDSKAVVVYDSDSSDGIAEFLDVSGTTITARAATAFRTSSVVGMCVLRLTDDTFVVFYQTGTNIEARLGTDATSSITWGTAVQVKAESGNNLFMTAALARDGIIAVSFVEDSPNDGQIITVNASTFALIDQEEFSDNCDVPRVMRLLEGTCLISWGVPPSGLILARVAYIDESGAITLGTTTTAATEGAYDPYMPTAVALSPRRAVIAQNAVKVATNENLVIAVAAEIGETF